MPVITFACVAVFAIVGLAFYAIRHKVGLKVSAKALRQFEVSIEVVSPSGPHHDRLPADAGNDLSSIDQPDSPTRADRQGTE